MRKIFHKQLSYEVIGAAFAVQKALGPGLLERVYENALCIELERRNIVYERQKKYPVLYQSHLVGEYFADLVISNSIIVEIKTVQSFSPVMTAQLLHYLRISGISIGYLINFHCVNLQWKRYVSTE